uniref:Polymerase PB2 n=1 Tax=Astopletus virus TaxID=2800905 RepID=A0A894KLG4_9VIRU|nr:MAG: polymerase PB2 [Astopletus virus]
MGTNNKEEAKRILMALVQKVNKASVNTISILRTTPLCNLKTIQRRSKNLKDPNPLSSMMIATSNRYPLSVDTKKAAECKLPREFLGGPDSHQYGRTLCKIEALQWYSDHAPPPTDETKAAVDILFKAKRKEVRDHYAKDWEHSIIRYGAVLLVRKPVPTQEVVFEVPPGQRHDYLIAALMPDHYTNRGNLDPEILERLNEVKVLSIGAKLMLQSQLRILLNMFDPKVRFIPALDTASDNLNRVRYTVASGTHRVIVTDPTAGNGKEYSDFLSQLGRACWYLCSHKESVTAVRNAVCTSRYRGRPIGSILAQEVESQSIYQRFLRAIMGQDLVETKMVHGFEFYGDGKNMKSVRAENRKKVAFYRYTGDEMVDISRGTFKARVHRRGSFVNGFMCTRASLETIRNAVAALGVYLKLQFESSDAPTLRRISDQMFQRWLEAPWSVLEVSASDFNNAIIGRGSHPKIKIVESLEPGQRIAQQVTVRETKIVYENGRAVDVDRPRSFPLLPPDFGIDARYGNLFIDFLSPERMLLQKIGNLMSKIDEVRSWIQRGDFNQANFSVYAGVPRSELARVAGVARSLLVRGLSEGVADEVLMFWYCFAGGKTVTLSETAPISPFKWYQSHTIDFELDQGLVRFSAEEGLTVNGYSIRRGPDLEAQIVRTLIPHFRILGSTPSDYRLTTPNYVRAHPEAFREGERIKITLHGAEIYLQKDRTFQSDVNKTLYNRMSNQALPVSLDRLIARKRPSEAAASDPEAGPSSKRANYVPTVRELEAEHEFFSDEDTDEVL